MRKTQTKLPSEGKTSIRPKLNVRKDTTSDHYTVVIQIIRHRRRCVLFTPYRLRKEEFDDMRGIAITRQRNRTHREYIGQVNDYLRYHTGWSIAWNNRATLSRLRMYWLTIGNAMTNVM